ncbi:MAG: T9SS type B sorting domain-containing protein [Bacteroidales bacterium]
MKKKVTISLMFSLLLSVSLQAQTDNVIITHPANFYTRNQNAWGPDSTAELIFEVPIIPKFSIDVPKLSQNYITEVAYMDFGVAFEADTWGSLGLKLGIRDKNGRIDINYESDVSLSLPASFNKGEEITIQTDFTPDTDKCSIESKNYDISLDMILDASFGAYLNARACAFDVCAYPELFNFDFEFINFELFSLSLDFLWAFDMSVSVPGIPDINGEIYRIKEDDDGMVDLTMRKPNKGPTSQSMNNKILYCRSAPYMYDSLTLDIPRVISYILEKIAKKTSDPAKKKKLSAASLIMKNLNKSVSLGSVKAAYNILTSHLHMTTYHNQLLTFKPRLMNQMTFPTLVDYKILSPNDSLIKTGNDSIINIEVGNKLKFRYPCNYEFMNISSEYSLKNENNFILDSYDSVTLNFTISALGFSLKMDNIQVIPRICVDIPYPCPTWKKPWKWCSEEVCTPAVIFYGFDLGLGPLYSGNYQLTQFKYRWKQDTWFMKGFNAVPADVIRIQPKPFYVSIAANPVKCYGQNSGNATATVFNGTPPYTYEWSTGSTSKYASNLGHGTHYVIVRDANGCSAFADVYITQPEAPLSITESITHVDCHGNNTGSIDVSLSGGTLPYTYIWTGNKTSEDLELIAAGNYNLKVTDGNACILTKNYTILQPYPLVVEAESTDVRCYGDSTATLELSVNGGIAPYQYAWAPGNNNEPAIQGLAAGIYSYTVTDFNACEVANQVEIHQPSFPLSASVTINDVRCFGEASGNILISLSGGTGPFSSTWYNASGQILIQNSTNLLSVTAGIYNAVISDSQECMLDTNITLNEPADIQWNTQVTDNLCFGESKGAIEINTTGGIPPYSYVWSNGNTGPINDNLPADIFYVTITDHNVCSHVTSAVVAQPATAVTASITPTHVLCYGENTGKADLSPAGGVMPYTYQWSTGFTGEDLMYIQAGTYYATVTDTNGCTAFTGIMINQPDEALAIQSVIINPSCNGMSNGSINVLAEGGTSPYYLRWDDNEYLLSSKGHLLENLPAGTYDILVKDANNCQSSQNFLLTQPEVLSLQTTSTVVNCYGGSDGTIDLSVNGGTLPFSYQWTNGALSEDINGLPAGYYSVTVTDEQDCMTEITAEVGTMPEIITIPTITPISCIDNIDGSIELEAFGGDGNYSYRWSTNSNDDKIYNLLSGPYSVEITDGLDCSRSFDFMVPSSPEECIFIPSLFTPNNDGKNDTWVIRNIFLYPGNSVKVFNRLGQLLFERSPYSPAWDGTYNGEPIPSETYYYIINLNNGTAIFTGPVTIVR